MRWIIPIVMGLFAVPLSAQQNVVSGAGAMVRVLDKAAGVTQDITLRTAQPQAVGPLSLYLRDCRYPAANPTGNAYASLEIVENGKPGALFSGWMIASSPALNAMEHHRFDVWVIRCTTS